MDYLNNHGYTNTYLPRRESTSITKSYTQKSVNLAEAVHLDAMYDLQRWISNSKSEIDNYVSKKVWYDCEREIKEENELLDLKLECTDIRGFLVDMRKGIDWFKNNFSDRPTILVNFYNKINQRNERLTKIKKYLSTRVRRYAALNAINNDDTSIEVTKLIQRKVIVELKALDIFLSNNKRYTERKSMDEIMKGGDE